MEDLSHKEKVNIHNSYQGTALCPLSNWIGQLIKCLKVTSVHAKLTEPFSNPPAALTYE